MAKPQQQGKQAMPGPYDPQPTSTKPQAARKASNPKFYLIFKDGPTVSAKVNEAKTVASNTAKSTAAKAKKQSKRAVATAQRHPWSFISLLTTIPFLLTISLFSTVVCPPPSETLSPVSRFVLAPLGLHDHTGQHSQLHQTLCYPSNVYHRTVLQPYIYPIVNDLQDRAARHPVYVKGIDPAYRSVTATSDKLWNGPVKPIVQRVQRGARKIYLTFVEPHLPYLRAKTAALTAPYTSRVSAFHKSHVSPHIDTAGKYARQAGKRSVDTYSYVAAHPLTDQAGRYANKGYQVASTRAQQAYTYTRPHAIRAGKEVERIAREILGPRAVQAIEYAGAKAAQGFGVVKSHVERAYYRHLDPYVGPHVAKARAVLAPYASAFHKNIYLPYILPVLESILPPAVLAPEPPRSMWALLSEILPGSHVAERTGDMNRFHEQVDKARKPANVPVPGAEKVAKAASAQSSTKQAKKFDRDEMNRVRDAIKERVDKQGQKGAESVKKELLALHTSILADDDKLPALKRNAMSEIERELEYVTAGLDKLYSSSTSLTRDQVEKSSAQGDARAARKVKQIRDRADKMKAAWHEQGTPIVRAAFDDLERALGPEYSDLKEKMAWMDDVTPKVGPDDADKTDSQDWTMYNALRDDVEKWSAKYIALHNGETKDRAMNAPSANIHRAISSFSTDLTDLYEHWKTQVRQLKKVAVARIEAREALAAESASASAKVDTATKSVRSVTEEGKATILPIVEEGAAAAAAAAAAGIIGKGKDQVVEALSQASVAARGEATSAGVVDQAKASASSIYDAASSGVHDVTRSVISAAGGTPSPESPREHAESLANVVSSAAGDVAASASSIYDAAATGVHDATRSIVSAVGGTPSPESPREHAESIANVASAAAEDAVKSVSSVVHDATRSAMSAVGATPSPESVGEHVESIASGVSASAASAASVASASAAYLADAAGSAVHDGTRAAQRAVGVTPSPETPGEYVQSAASVASASLDSAASAAGDAAQSAYTQATASAASAHTAASDAAGSAGAAVTDQAASLAAQIQEALGLVSTPEPIASTASSYLAQLSSAAATDLPSAVAGGQAILASLRDQAASNLHQATRAASRAVGAKPTPETPGEYVEDVKDRIQSVAEDLGSRASVQGEKATEGVKRAMGRDEL